MFERKSVWAAGGDFSDPTLYWYAKGVGVLKERPITDPTSWLFLAAMHGINKITWIAAGYLTNDTPLPSQSLQDIYWNQCQHQSWYFLPWHRGYLYSLESLVRDAIIKAGGPTDWALPYWNYSDTSNPNALNLPTAFSDETMPVNPDGSGGTTANPLYVKQRYGANYGTLPLLAKDVNLKPALTRPYFTGANSGGSSGFGGVRVDLFTHFGNIQGGLESLPHNPVHVDIGGRGGLMSDNNAAGLDPIFYLHHANIDRLWEVWLNIPTSQGNPGELSWQKGPANRKFIVPMPGGQGWQYDALMVESTKALNYEYDDISDPLQGVSALNARLEKLGKSPNPSFSISGSDEAVSNQLRTELIGANNNKITLLGTSIATQVQLDKQMVQNTNMSFAAFDASEEDVAEPDHIYLNVENIRSKTDGNAIDVYVNLPSGADPAEHPDLYVGSIAFFGVANASKSDQPHGGMGITEVLDITHVVDALQLAGKLDTLSSLEVSLLPRTPFSEEDEVTVDRISVYREGK